MRLDETGDLEGLVDVHDGCTAGAVGGHYLHIAGRFVAGVLSGEGSIIQVNLNHLTACHPEG